LDIKAAVGRDEPSVVSYVDRCAAFRIFFAHEYPLPDALLHFRCRRFVQWFLNFTRARTLYRDWGKLKNQYGHPEFGMAKPTFARAPFGAAREGFCREMPGSAHGVDTYA
jgi:hypothetical protein